MRAFPVFVAALVIAGCAPRASDSTDKPAAAGAPPIGTLLRGLWSGTAKKSPLGVQPYAIAFRKEGAAIVGETPPTLGEEELPPGAYQFFQWKDGAASTKVAYRTAMGEQGELEGELELDATRSNAQKLFFCEPNACERMELRWESLAPDKMSFQVWIDGRLHADIALAFDGEL